MTSAARGERRSLAEIQRECHTYQGILRHGNRLSGHDAEHFLHLLDELEAAKHEVWQESITVSRREYIGELVRLTGLLADPYNTANPFAYAPEYHKAWRLEEQEWEFGSVSNTGIVVKGRSEEGVLAISDAVAAIEPLIGAFGLGEAFSHVYELAESPDPFGDGGQCIAFQNPLMPRALTLLPSVPAGRLLYLAIHELAHIGFHGHDAGFQTRLGDLLAWYLTQPDSVLVDAVLREVLEDDYCPFFHDGLWKTAPPLAEQLWEADRFFLNQREHDDFLSGRRTDFE